MAGIDFTSLTPKNGAVQDLAELIFLELVEDDKLGQLVTFMPRQENGKKLGFVGKAGLLGKKAKGCDPEYAKNLVQASEKTWDLQEWEIAEEICYKELENTIAEHFAANGSDMADLTSSEYMEKVVRPILEQAIRDLMIRFIFFGDKNAEGSLKDGVDAEYFTLIDGIFKQLFEGVTAGKTTRVAIDANTKTTVAAQYEAMRQPGAATGVLNNLIINTPMKLRRMADRVFIVTQAFADMLNLDIQENNKGSELQWESLFAGIQKTSYQGITLVAGGTHFNGILLENGTKYAIRGATTADFRDKYRGKDLLLVDDIQFIAGKESTQEEFFHTFNALHEAGKQIIMTSDRPPRDIKTLEDRLKSRFEWGLIADIARPDIETRIAILRKKRRLWKSTLISDEVLEYLAKNITRSVRRLEGALVRLATFASFSQKSPTVQDARVQLNDLLKEEKNTTDVTVADIQRRVAEEFNIRVADINGRRRTANIAHPRQVAMFLARRHTQNSLQDIGAAFGGRDHGTVIHATKTIEEKMETDPTLRDLVDRLASSLA